MNSLRCAQKMLALAPKCSVARSVNKISLIHRPSQIPAPFNRSTIVVADRMMCSWIGSAWNSAKNTVLDNWESAGIIKKRKPDDEDRKSARSANVDRGDNAISSAEELAKAKNKAQRRLAENWDAIKQANAKTNQSIVDNAKEGATKTIDELAKSVKETAGKLIDETTKDLKSKIKDKAENVKEKISTDNLINETTKKVDDLKEKMSK